MTNYPKIRAAAIAATIALSCAGSWAARDFTPQSGTWVVSSEVDGKPGRGLAIDVQGNTFFMQVFGYEKNGDATFYTATGQMDGNSVTAPLMRYKNGRSLGGVMQDAVEDQSVGSVTVNFRNGLKGSIQFPGEPALAIERFLVVNNQPSVTNPRVQLGARTLRLFALDAQGDPTLTVQAKLRRTEDGSTLLGWMGRPTLIATGESGPQFQCEVADDKNRMHCLPVVNKSLSKPRSELPIVESLDLQFAGYDIHGVLRTGGDKPQTLVIVGFDDGAVFNEPSYREERTTYVPQQQHNYSNANFGSGICTLTCYVTTTANTLMPMNGTWVVEDELTGKPGRGIALDIQGNAVILQLFNYRADGQPTFHMGSATYQSKGMKTRASVATIPLRQYRGGRSLGGAAQSAQVDTDAGNAILEFNSPPPENGAIDHQIWWTQGQLQLPGEAPVKIRRLQTDTPASFSERMFGDWYVSLTDKMERFDRVQGDGVTTASGKILCLPNGISPGSNMTCGEPNGTAWAWHGSRYLPDMGRFGPFLRLRDRFGNSVGLGALD